MFSCAESDRLRQCVVVTQPNEWHAADMRQSLEKSSLIKQINNWHTSWSVNFILTGAFFSKIFDFLTVGYLTRIWILYIPTDYFLQRYFYCYFHCQNLTWIFLILFLLKVSIFVRLLAIVSFELAFKNNDVHNKRGDEISENKEMVFNWRESEEILNVIMLSFCLPAWQTNHP